MMIMMMSNDDDDIMVSTAAKSWVSTTAKISEMRRSRRSRWCQDVYHRIYLDVYHRKMKNMMMLVMMMMMMVSWIHHEVIILRHHLLPGAASRVEDRDPWRIRSHLRCTMQNALQIQVIFDEIIKIAISVTIIAHIVLLVLHYKSIWCVSRVVDFVAWAYMHTCEALCKWVM